MKLLGCVCVLLAIFVSACDAGDSKKQLQIGIKKKVENCQMTAKKGDSLSMHYTGKLEDGTEFDSSIPRNEPFTFTLGVGQVIKGWDMGKWLQFEFSSSLNSRWLLVISIGLLDMCEGEKRKLVIPSHLGYGDAGAGGKIPGM